MQTKSLRVLALAAVSFLLAPSANADLDENQAQALGQTRDLMNSSSDRQEYIQSHPDAAAADQKVKDLAQSPEQEQAIYAISSQVYAPIAAKTGGDTVKQQQILDQAQRDPAAFYEGLPAEQKAAIQDLAGQMERISPSGRPGAMTPAR